MRLIVSADTHLGSPIRSAALRNPALGDRLKQAGRDTFQAIVDLAIREKADALVLAGDIFDSDYPDLRSRAFLMTQLLRASGAGVPTVLIRGNHDALLDHGELGPDIHLLDRANPTVQIGNANFHGLSFEANHTTQSFLPDYPAPVTGKTNIGLMHTSLGGSPGHDPYAPCSKQDLLAHGYDLWCLGHIHLPSTHAAGDVLAVMPGIPQPRHFGERFGGSVAMVTLGDDAPELVMQSVGHLRFLETTLDLTHCADQSEVITLLANALRDAQDPDCDTALRVIVTTAQHTVDDLDALVAEQLYGIDRVYVDKIKTVLPKATVDGDPDDLMRFMRAALDEDGFRQAAAQVLSDLRGALPADVRDVLADENLNALLDDALVEVSQSLHGLDGA